MGNMRKHSDKRNIMLNEPLVSVSYETGNGEAFMLIDDEQHFHFDIIVSHRRMILMILLCILLKITRNPFL